LSVSRKSEQNGKTYTIAVSDRVDSIRLGAHSRHGAQRVHLPEPGVEVFQLPKRPRTSAVVLAKSTLRFGESRSHRADCGWKTIRSRVRVARAKRSSVSVDGRTVPPSIRAM